MAASLFHIFFLGARVHVQAEVRRLTAGVRKIEYPCSRVVWHNALGLEASKALLLLVRQTSLTKATRDRVLGKTGVPLSDDQLNIMLKEEEERMASLGTGLQLIHDAFEHELDAGRCTDRDDFQLVRDMEGDDSWGADLEKRREKALERRAKEAREKKKTDNKGGAAPKRGPTFAGGGARRQWQGGASASGQGRPQGAGGPQARGGGGGGGGTSQGASRSAGPSGTCFRCGAWGHHKWQCRVKFN